jgi:hypothetical protein
MQRLHPKCESCRPAICEWCFHGGPLSGSATKTSGGHGYRIRLDVRRIAAPRMRRRRCLPALVHADTNRCLNCLPHDCEWLMVLLSGWEVVPQAGGRPPVGAYEVQSTFSKKGAIGNPADARVGHCRARTGGCAPRGGYCGRRSAGRGFTFCDFAGRLFTASTFNELRAARPNHEKGVSTLPGAGTALRLAGLPRSISEGGGSLRRETGD